MINITVDIAGVKRKINNMQKELDKIPTDAHKFFVATTPKKSGNARNKTKLKGNTIMANYKYAGALDRGWSKKAPEGMVRPTFDFIVKSIKNIVRKF